MVKLSLVLSFFFSTIAGFAQQLSKADQQQFRQKEDSLKVYARKIIQDINPQNRFNADSIFTRMFVRTLRTTNSFQYHFDSLETISQLYPPDSSFRIFTWQMVVNDNVIRQHGAIQMKTSDGSLKLFPLIDKSDVTINQQDTTGNNKGWIGAVYYRLLQHQSSSQNFYTLLGYDENNIRSTKKIIDVLTFSNDEPVFGGRHFSFEEDTPFKSATSRYIMEFKKSAGARLTYDVDKQMIIFEHLESESGETNKKWTFIPDGDYEGFKWKNGKWIHVNKVFDYVTPEGQEPMPNPIKDGQGNTDEEKLQDNFNNEQEPVDSVPVTKPAPPVKKPAAKKPKT